MSNVSINLNLFVTYLVSQKNDLQQKAIENFLFDQQNPTKVIDTFTETIENHNKYNKYNKWPELQKAINCCKEYQATLLIAKLGTLTSNGLFVNILLNSGVKFYCCDQPFVDRIILNGIHQHSQIQKKLHGDSIREGLEKTSAKSGNPNAAAVINKVNKPKIDAAIIFAFLLQPIVANYKQQSFSQRQMVKSLNEEGFTAPEGGKWVLSQLQKVLDRVKINEIVLKNQEMIESLLSNNQTSIQIAEELNRQQIPSIKKNNWDESQVNKILFRIKQIKDIENTNKFIIDLLPVLHNFKLNNYSSKEILQFFENHGVNINEVGYN